MIKIILKLLLVAVLGFLAAWYYSQVLPAFVAGLFGLAVAGALGWSMLGGGFKLSPLVFGGTVLAVWPAGALVAGWVAPAPLTPAVAMGASWWAPALAAQFASASKVDGRRDLATVSLALVGAYTVVAATASSALLAMALACGAPAAAALVAASVLEIPPRHRAVLRAGAVAAAAAGALLATRHLLA